MGSVRDLWYSKNSSTMDRTFTMPKSREYTRVERAVIVARKTVAADIATMVWERL
jgi:hypothetical protein